jgi:hypothetical protein
MPKGEERVITFIKRLWAAAPAATLILGLALAATGFFAIRTALFSVYWHDPAHREQKIEGWMTPGFVAHSWHVPREVVLEAIDAPPSPGHPMNLDAIAQDRDMPVEELIGEIEAAIAASRAEHEPPAPAPAPPPAGDGAGQ